MVLLGQQVNGVDAWTAQHIREIAEQETFLMGNDEFAHGFRAYRQYLNYELWQAAAKRSDVNLSWVRSVMEGKSYSPSVIRALEAELEARELVTSDTPTRRELISTPSKYSGVYSRVAKQLGVTRQQVRRVAIGEQASANIAERLPLRCCRSSG